MNLELCHNLDERKLIKLEICYFNPIVMQLRSIRLLTENFGEQFRFYRDFLGFEVLWGEENGVYAEFKASEKVTIALFQRQIMKSLISEEALSESSSVEDHFSLIFGVDNVDTNFEKLVKKGCSVEIGPRNREEWGYRTSHFRDTEGNLIEINKELENC